MSLTGRIYPEVQNFITERMYQKSPPRTSEIIRHVFGDQTNQDSRIQRDAVYQAITRGRDLALAKMELYLESNEYYQDLAEIEYYASDLIDQQETSADYADFFSELHMGRFGDKTDLIKGNLRPFALIAALWERKLQEYSEKGMNLVIASYGKDSGWFIPSWWKWATRETDLYLRSLKIVEKQLKRGSGTKMLTASGQPISKAIGYVGSARALLEDGASWSCQCGMMNPGSANYCSNCGEAKPDT